MPGISYNGRKVNNSVENILEYSEQYLTMGKEIEDIAEKLLSTTGWSEVATISSPEDLSSHLENCKKVFDSLCTQIRQIQLEILKYNQNEQDMNLFFNSISESEWKSLNFEGGKSLESFKSYISNQNFDAEIAYSTLGEDTKVGFGTKILTGILGFGEGVLDFFETGVDFFVGGFGTVAGLFGWDSAAEKAVEFTKKELVSDLFDEQVYGKISSIARYRTLHPEEFGTVRSITNGLGYASAMIVVGTKVPGINKIPLPKLAGALGASSALEDAYNDGASYEQAALSAAVSGGWESLQWNIGIGQHNLTKGWNKALGAVTRVAIDTGTGAAEGAFIDPIKYMARHADGSNIIEAGINVVKNIGNADARAEAFEAAGGTRNLVEKTVIAGTMSAASEVADPVVDAAKNRAKNTFDRVKNFFSGGSNSAAKEAAAAAVSGGTTREVVGDVASRAAASEAAGDTATRAAASEAAGDAATRAAASEAAGDAATRAATREAAGDAATRAAASEAAGDAATRAATREATGDAATRAATREAAGDAASKAGAREALGDAATRTGVSEVLGDAATRTGVSEVLGDAATIAAASEAAGDAATRTGVSEVLGDAATIAAASEAAGDAVTRAATREAAGDAATRAATREAAGDVASRAAASEAVGDAASKAGAREALGDEASKTATREALGDEASKTATREALGDEASKAGARDVLGDEASKAGAREATGTAAEKSMLDDNIKHVKEPTTEVTYKDPLGRETKTTLTYGGADGETVIRRDIEGPTGAIRSETIEYGADGSITKKTITTANPQASTPIKEHVSAIEEFSNGQLEKRTLLDTKGNKIGEEIYSNGELVTKQSFENNPAEGKVPYTKEVKRNGDTVVTTTKYDDGTIRTSEVTTKTVTDSNGNKTTTRDITVKDKNGGVTNTKVTETVDPSGKRTSKSVEAVKKGYGGKADRSVTSDMTFKSDGSVSNKDINLTTVRLDKNGNPVTKKGHNVYDNSRKIVEYNQTPDGTARILTTDFGPKKNDISVNSKTLTEAGKVESIDKRFKTGKEIFNDFKDNIRHPAKAVKELGNDLIERGYVKDAAKDQLHQKGVTKPDYGSNGKNVRAETYAREKAFENGSFTDSIKADAEKATGGIINSRSNKNAGVSQYGDEQAAKRLTELIDNPNKINELSAKNKIHYGWSGTPTVVKAGVYGVGAKVGTDILGAMAGGKNQYPTTPITTAPTTPTTTTPTTTGPYNPPSPSPYPSGGDDGNNGGDDGGNDNTPDTTPITTPDTIPDTTPPTNPEDNGNNNTGGNNHGWDNSNSGYESNPDGNPGENLDNNDQNGDDLSDEDKLLDDDNLGDLDDDSIYTIPTITNNSNTKVTKDGINAIPILAGLGLAAAAGVGAKIYMDNKKNNDNGEEEYDDEFKSDSDYMSDSDFDSLSSQDSDLIADDWTEESTPQEGDESLDYERPSFYSDTLGEEI